MGVSGFVNHVHLALRSLNCDGRRGLVLLCAALLLVLPTLAGEGGQAWLRYERGALAQGQWWRLVTAHLVHLDVRHALLNTAGLALVWMLFARDYSPKAWLVILLAAMAAIDAGLWLGDSTVQWYVGSSGVLHGAMAAGALAHIRRGERDGWVLAALLAAKLLYEQSVGPLPLSGHDPVVVDAHLYGVLGGTVSAAFLSPHRVPL
ncbi:MAG: rhombosortase [Gammaproteobacteria bacterium]|nr:rhombosortase [Gammaproteobacteria bacterium]